MMSELSLGAILQKSVELSRRNPIVFAPGLIGGVILAVLHDLLFPPFGVHATSLYGDFASRGLRSLVEGVAGMFINLAAGAATFGIAARLWEIGNVMFDDATRVFREQRATTVSIIWRVICFIVLAVILAVPTFGLSLCAAAYFMLYALAAGVIGGTPGYAAIKESAGIAKSRIGDTVGLIGIYIVAVLAIFLIGAILGALPLVGPFIGTLLGSALNSLFVVAIAGEYIEARRHAAPLVLS